MKFSKLYLLILCVLISIVAINTKPIDEFEMRGKLIEADDFPENRPVTGVKSTTQAVTHPPEPEEPIDDSADPRGVMTSKDGIRFRNGLRINLPPAPAQNTVQ